MMTFITVKVLLILILTDNGILFEQASARGHAQESANGITFRLLLGTIYYQFIITASSI
jgi:hypothetical protein